ncbi:MAG: PAS domain-containing protein, partial [Candidatus Electrothrix sp. ATG2]|nr:PAS domain-containing protein [Candidatus Electrothrix sp. ATG2]
DSEHVYLKTFESQVAQRRHYTWYKASNTITCSSIDLLAMWKSPIKLLAEDAIIGPGSWLPSFLREEFEQNNIRTYLILPIYVYKQLWGCIGFDCSLSGRPWDEPLVEAMKTSSDIIGTAIQRTFESRERSRLAAAINEFADCVLMTDKVGTIFYANPASMQVTGYLPEELVGLKLGQIQFDEQDRFVCREVLNSVAEGEEWHGEVKNRHKDGTSYDESVAIIPVKRESDRVNGFCVIHMKIVQLPEQNTDRHFQRIQRVAQFMPYPGKNKADIIHKISRFRNRFKPFFFRLITFDNTEAIDPVRLPFYWNNCNGLIIRGSVLMAILVVWSASPSRVLRRVVLPTPDEPSRQ